jgi:hypothetical protein
MGGFARNNIWPTTAEGICILTFRNDFGGQLVKLVFILDPSIDRHASFESLYDSVNIYSCLVITPPPPREFDGNEVHRSPRI